MIESCVEIVKTDESCTEMLKMVPDPQDSLTVFQLLREE